jgi:hypothetical protein
MAEEKRKIGRNDPCPCGSGKKYKKCCYPDKTRAWKTAGSHESPVFTVELKETPEPITNHLVSSHLVSSDGGKTWKHQPGLMEVRIYGKDQKNMEEAISRIIEPVWRDLFGDVEIDFLDRMRNVEHKLYAVKHHLNNYERAERDKIEEFRKNYKPPTGAQEVIEEPRLIYEVEAFPFQVKSCLDVLSRVLEPVFGFSHCLFEDEGDKVINQLRNNCPADIVPYGERIIRLIEDSQEAWIVELVKMRVQITHYSSLDGFDCFIQDPYIGGRAANIHYPTMPNQRRALEYCQYIWTRLLSFCEDFLKFTAEGAKAKLTS